MSSDLKVVEVCAGGRGGISKKNQDVGTVLHDQNNNAEDINNLPVAVRDHGQMLQLSGQVADGVDGTPHLLDHLRLAVVELVVGQREQFQMAPL